jgi:hypothetical protein
LLRVNLPLASLKGLLIPLFGRERFPRWQSFFGGFRRCVSAFFRIKSLCPANIPAPFGCEICFLNSARGFVNEFFCIII